MAYLSFFKKIKFENSDKTSMISSKPVSMKNSQPALYGSKHLLALQTLSHCDCIIVQITSQHSKVSTSFRTIIARFCCSCIAFLSTAWIKHIPAEYNLII